MTKIVYPQGPVTPHGRYHIRKGDLPMVSLMSANEQIILWMMGGQAIADPTRPESAQVEGIRGLIAPWEHVTEKGATQDGIDVVDSLYGPTEIDIDVLLVARDAKHLRRLWRHVIESIDAKAQSEFGWMTHEMGYWWAPVRWNKVPTDPMVNPNQCQQPMTLRLLGDHAFWQSYPDVAQFGILFADMVDKINYDTSADHDMGPNWPQHYDGPGGGYMFADGNRAVWHDDPSWTGTRNREVVNGPYRDPDTGETFETTGDNQVVSFKLGSVPEWSTVSGANDGWARLNHDEDGEWAGTGIRGRVTLGQVEISAWIDFEQVWVKKQDRFGFIPWFDDEYTLVAGYTDNARVFKILRNGGELFSIKEVGTQSMLGPDYRGVGFGARAGGAFFTQATPSTVKKVWAGDNAELTQSGFLERRNAGDQSAYDEYTLYGPATKFSIQNGPGSPDMVEFGPLGVGEIAHIRTDPRNKGVFNYSALTGAEVAPALFGKNPTDDMYRKMKGRFTKGCAIPPKEAGMRVKTYQIKVGITGGNADSKILAQLTPLRRHPQ